MSEPDPKRTLKAALKMLEESRKARDDARFRRLKEETKERIFDAAWYYAKGETWHELEERFGESFARELRKPTGYKVLFQSMVRRHVLSRAWDGIEPNPRYAKLFRTGPRNKLFWLAMGFSPSEDQ